ncbi:MAG TPA: EAL domain-containing protein [Thermoanaerobaculia bacterium]|jgi:EAL domain-containing protein (putative c-di-GMP-specific phosphodiesterase class I)|nr:EAL domain-containing protein [Thermoanaerobaculia bacterium]
MFKVLVLDDESMVVDMLALALRAPDVHLTTCLEIEAAEALLGQYRFDAVVTDLSVSPLGGLEGVRLIRFVATHFPDTALYVLSGFLDESVRSICHLMGVAAVLDKPGGLGELRRLLLAEQARQAAASAEIDAPKSPPQPPTVEKVPLLESFLAAGPLHALLQPVVPLFDGGPPFEVFGVEGLARGPAGALLGMPSLLFAYAAKKELAFEVDLLCIRAALAEFRPLPGRLTAFLNVQPRSLTHPEFTPRLVEALRTAEVEHDRVILELTEQHTILNPRAFAATLAKLRDLGLRIALDDFGEGSSNLNLFLDLRPEFLKISSAFCRGVEADPFKQALVRSTAEMAARTGAKTVMEAVETAEEAEEIRRLGVDFGQGHFFSTPRTGRELAADESLHIPPAS